MNELELFSKWFNEQKEFVIKERNSDFSSGTVPFEGVYRKYMLERDDVILKEIILKTLENRLQTTSDEKVAEMIMKEFKELREDVI